MSEPYTSPRRSSFAAPDVASSDGSSPKVLNLTPSCTLARFLVRASVENPKKLPQNITVWSAKLFDYAWAQNRVVMSMRAHLNHAQPQAHSTSITLLLGQSSIHQSPSPAPIPNSHDSSPNARPWSFSFSHRLREVSTTSPKWLRQWQLELCNTAQEREGKIRLDYVKAAEEAGLSMPPPES